MEQPFREPTNDFAQLLQERRKAVFAVAYAKLRNSHDAEDVTQEVLLDAHRNRYKLGNHTNISAWLYKATAYRCVDYARKMSRRERREAAYAELVSTRSSQNHSPEDEKLDLVVQAVGLLPERLRIVVMLRHFALLPYADITRMTGLPKTTIDGRLRTAKKKLRRELAAAVLD